MVFEIPFGLAIGGRHLGVLINATSPSPQWAAPATATVFPVALSTLSPQQSKPSARSS